MKKIFYIVLVIVILLVIGQIIRKNQAQVAEPEVVTVEENIVVEGRAAENADANADGAVAIEEEEVVVVDHEPTAEETEVDENVVETNPEATAGQDETIVE